MLKKCDPGREFCLKDVARVVGSDLAYVFEIQGFDAKLPGREMPLRVTRRRVEVGASTGGRANNAAGAVLRC